MPERTTESQCPVGMAVLDCTSDEERMKMTAGWGPEDWCDTLLDLGLYYESELESVSVHTVAGLLAFPLGCLLGALLSYALFVRCLPLHLPLVGKVPSEASRLSWLCVTLLTCSAEPLVALLGYGKPTFADGLLAAYLPGVFYASTAAQAVPMVGALSIAACAAFSIRAFLHVMKALSEEPDPLPPILFNARSEIQRLAIVLQAIMLLALMGIMPAGRASMPVDVSGDARDRIAKLAGNHRPVSADELQGTLDELQMAVCVEARELGIAPERTPRVIATLIPNQNIYAAYRSIDNTIIVNALDLTDRWLPATPGILLFGCFHELYHCQQLRYVSSEASIEGESVIDLDEGDLQRWKGEFALYPILSATPSGYSALEVEKTANRWARAKFDEYREAYEADVARELEGRAPDARRTTR